MPDQTPCPVCKATPVQTEARGDVLDVDCPHCGPYSISGTTISVLPGIIGKDRRKAVLIGHALRQMQATDKRPSLTSDVAQRLVESFALPSVSAQADNLVRWLGDNCPDIGQMATVSLEKHGAFIGTTSLEGLHLILSGLRDAGLIKWYPTMGSSQSLHITFQGMTRYEDLRAAAPKTAPPLSSPISHRYAAIMSTDIVVFPASWPLMRQRPQ